MPSTIRIVAIAFVFVLLEITVQYGSPRWGNFARAERLLILGFRVAPSDIGVEPTSASGSARFRNESGRQHYDALGAADDARDPAGLTVFSFAQAQVKARDFFTRKAQEIAGDFVCASGPFTIADALAAYLVKYLRRGGKAGGRIESAGRTYILPELGQLSVSKLTKRRLEEWHNGVANSPARVRTPEGGSPRFRPHAVTPEASRRRRATANRILTIFKAALNEAYCDRFVPINDAWQRIKPFRKVDSARIRYLTDDEARRLVNACPTHFRALVIGGLMTGCRYGELAALLVEDFNVDSGTTLFGSVRPESPGTLCDQLKAANSPPPTASFVYTD